MNDISPLLFFYFWQPVYYLLDAQEQSFPGKSKELRGRWAGISEHIGHKMTFKIITDDTGEEICRSLIRSAIEPGTQNLQLDPVITPTQGNLLTPTQAPTPVDAGTIENLMSPTGFISPIVKSEGMEDINRVMDPIGDTQQRHFQYQQPPSNVQPRHRYPLQSR